jgi:hypothetical protein
MSIEEQKIAGVLLGDGADSPKLLRARALDTYLAEVEEVLAKGSVAEALELIGRMRKFISWTTTPPAN